MKAYYLIGLDLGQRRDHSGIVVAERRVMRGLWNPVLGGYPDVVRLEMQHSERFALGTDYMVVVRRMVEIRKKLEGLGGVVRVAVDATGVGVAVVDMLKAAGLGGVLLPVTATGGSSVGNAGGGKAVGGDRAGDFVSVPKSELFYGLLVAMEQGRTVFSKKMPGLQDLLAELREIGVELGERGRRVTGAKGNRHDDLAFAAALAQYLAGRHFPADAAREEQRLQGRLL